MSGHVCPPQRHAGTLSSVNQESESKRQRETERKRERKCTVKKKKEEILGNLVASQSARHFLNDKCVVLELKRKKKTKNF